MSILKPKEKNPAPSAMTGVDKAASTLAEILKDTEAATARSRDRIRDLDKQKAVLKKEYDDRAVQIAGMKADYLKILDETTAEAAAEIEGEAVTKADLEAGRVSINEFLKVGKKKETIAHEARLAGLKKMSAVRDSVRSLGLKQYELAAKIADLGEKISREFSIVAENFWHRLDGLKRVLETQGIFSSGILTTHAAKKESDNDLAMARSGSAIYSGKFWKCRSVQDVRALTLDPIVQPEHFGALEKLADELEGQTFPLQINYLPAAGFGRGPGFTYFLGPQAYHQTGAKT